MNLLLQLGWSVRRRLLAVLRIRTRGVKVMLFNGRGELLLIRNNYGDGRAWLLPGGGAGRREEAGAAAARELKEEVGIEASLELLGTYFSAAEGKRDTVSLFTGRSDADLRIDNVEVAEAAFFLPEALPAEASPATRRRIGEWLSGGPYGGAW